MELNQFGQSVQKGMLDQRAAVSVITVQNDAAGSTLMPGQIVKFSTAAGKLPVVTASAAKTDVHVGVVVYNPMKESVLAGEVCEVALAGSVVYVEAAAVLPRGARVAWAANAQVSATATGNVVAGVLLDAASAAGSLVRMIVAGPFAPVA